MFLWAGCLYFPFPSTICPQKLLPTLGLSNLLLCACFLIVVHIDVFVGWLLVFSRVSCLSKYSLFAETTYSLHLNLFLCACFVIIVLIDVFVAGCLYFLGCHAPPSTICSQKLLNLETMGELNYLNYVNCFSRCRILSTK